MSQVVEVSGPHLEEKCRKVDHVCHIVNLISVGKHPFETKTIEQFLDEVLHNLEVFSGVDLHLAHVLK